MKHYIKTVFNTRSRLIKFRFIMLFMLATVIFSLLCLHFTIDQYKHYAASIKPHQQVAELNTLHAERLNALFDGEVIENYNFTFQGINTFMVPSPLSVFDLGPSYGTITEGNIIAGGPIEMNDVIIDIFLAGDKAILGTFSGTIFFMGGILFLIIGYTIFNINAASMLDADDKRKLSFLPRVIAALLSVIVVDGIFMGLALLFSHYKGLTFPVDTHIFYIYLLFVMSHAIAMCIGALAAALRSYVKKMTLRAGAIYMCILASILVSVTYIHSIYHEKESRLRHLISYGQLEQMTIFNAMYKKLLDLGENFGHGDVKSKQVQEIVLNYLNNDYKKVEAIETHQIDVNMDYYNYVNRLEKFFPHSFFSLMLQEITGSGNSNTIDFNIYLRDKNRRYLQAIIENVYFPDEKTGKTFFKDKEPFYSARSYIPKTIYQGIGIMLVYIVVLLTVTYFNLRISLPREIARIMEENEQEKARQEQWKALHNKIYGHDRETGMEEFQPA